MTDTMVERGGFFPPNMRIAMHSDGIRFIYPVTIKEMIETGLIKPEYFDKPKKSRRPTVEEFFGKRPRTFLEQMQQKYPEQ